MIVRLKHNNKLKNKPAKRNIGFSKTLWAIINRVKYLINK